MGGGKRSSGNSLGVDFFPFFVRGPPLRKSYVPLPWAFSTVSKGRGEAEQWKFPRGVFFPFFCKGTPFAKKLCSLALGIIPLCQKGGGKRSSGNSPGVDFFPFS